MLKIKAINIEKLGLNLLSNQAPIIVVKYWLQKYLFTHLPIRLHHCTFISCLINCVAELKVEVHTTGP